MSYKTKNKSNFKRYLIATILPIILLSITLAFSIFDHIKQYKFTQKELIGIYTIEYLYGGLTELQKVRGYTQIALWNDDDVNENLKILKKRFLDRFQKQAWKQQVNELTLVTEVERLYDEAQKVFQVNGSDIQDRELFTRYSNLISDVLQLIQLVADRSHLILDPELDTYYLIDVVGKQIPYLAATIGRVRGTGSGLLSKGIPSEDDLERLQSYQAAILTRIENILSAQEIIAKVSSNMKEELHLVPDEFDEVVTSLFKQCILIENSQVNHEMAPDVFFQLATKAIELLTKPHHAGIVMLTSRVQARQDKYLLQGVIVFLGTNITIALLLYFNRAFYLYDRKLYEAMAKLSITDQLTGLYNRRHLYNIFPRELGKTLRYRGHLYLAILDVDHFKRYNGTYGHPKGDIVLKQISETMEKVLKRGSDYCFRIGGEEFCIFFSDSDLQKAEKTINLIRLEIEKLTISHDGNKPFGVVTVSIGLVEVPTDLDSALETAMSKADQALYVAKETGRNRYEVS